MTAINPSWPDPASVEAAQHWAARAEAAAKPDIAMMIRHARQEAILLGGDQSHRPGSAAHRLKQVGVRFGPDLPRGHPSNVLIKRGE